MTPLSSNTTHFSIYKILVLLSLSLSVAGSQSQNPRNHLIYLLVCFQFLEKI
ncbi:hypothetical protein Patl1_05015 [Pistacia atlantica]|uniref:Uncharacterized protein n=1 Tax=Pistacia atlantica TaxID=434234 RepID=A0ACC1BP99_9ROSI|nr:hypothetical protein Patl1_05015 [Pistacia atlantica]